MDEPNIFALQERIRAVERMSEASIAMLEKEHDRRIGRLETAIIAIGLGSAGLVVTFVLRAIGFLK